MSGRDELTRHRPATDRTQNGPQRVYVELESTPWVWRLDANFTPTAQTGQSTQVLSCLVDENGKVYLHTPLGLGLVHTLDVAAVAQAIEQGLWQSQDCWVKDLPAQFGYVMSPQAGASAADIKKPT